MSARDLRAFFDAHKDGAAGLVMASVYETLGSTYSKTGARMLITAAGDFQGMLSGGCLEGDLAERAARVASSGVPEAVTYDLRRDDEELWGLGVGCEGLMRIFLQPLAAADYHQPFTVLIGVLEGERPGVVATVIDTADGDPAPGATLVGTDGGFRSVGLTAAQADALEPIAREVLAGGRSVTRTVGSATVLFAILEPPPRILVLGGGLDAEPVVRFCIELGWRVVVQDHRPAYIAKGDFGGAENVICAPAASLAGELDLDRFAAAIVMSHHLVSDREYLRQLADTEMAYIGLLGPRDRRERLIAELGDSGSRLAGRLHGPAGLDIGGRGPRSIALSIVSQLHQELMRNGA